MQIYEPRSARGAQVRRDGWRGFIHRALVVAAAVVVVAVLAPPSAARRPDALRSVDLRAVPESVRRRSRVVVLEIDSTDWSELLEHPLERGRRWERVGRVAFLSDGEVTLQAPVGVRIHGGSSRQFPEKSLRLYFRHSHGAAYPTGAELGLAGDTRHRTVVIHADVRADTGTLQFRYSNPIAYTIARRLGMPAPRAAPASLVINGGAPRPFVVTEHLSRNNLERWLRAPDLTLYDLRNARNRAPLQEAGPLAELRRRFGPMAGWSLDQVREVVDVDNLSRWFLTVLFCGTLDTPQGILIRHPGRPGPPWYWIAWDLDVSFGRRASQAPGAGDDFHLRTLLASDGPFIDYPGAEYDARVTLLRHLIRTSEAYRRELSSLFAVARDSLLTPAFLDSTVSEFERLAAEHGVADRRDLAVVRAYLARRPAALSEQLTRYLGANLP